MKISYLASKKQISILELFMTALVNSYRSLRIEPAEKSLGLDTSSSFSHEIIGRDNTYYG
jgi:hypothetical protein